MAQAVHGIVQRVKGKVAWGGQMPLQELPIDYIQAGAAGASTSLYPGGISLISSTSGQAILTMPVPEPGTYKTITVSTMSSGHLVIKTNSTTSVFVDSTTNSIWSPSTTITGIQTWRGYAVSSALWATVGMSPGGSSNPWGTSS